jgi:hypothetical protein
MFRPNPDRSLAQTLVLGAALIGTMMIGAVVLYAVAGWLWLVMHQAALMARRFRRWSALHTKPILFNRALRPGDISFLFLRCVDTHQPSFRSPSLWKIGTQQCLSFPKITSVRIRAVQQNQRMIQRDARGPDSDWSACRQPVQVAAPT